MGKVGGSGFHRLHVLNPRVEPSPAAYSAAALAGGMIGINRGFDYNALVAAMPSGATAQIPPEHIYTVTDIYPEHVVLDGNHPLAGMALRFELNVVDVRAASDEEIAHGHVHGAHGHHHEEMDDSDEGDHFRSQPLQ